MAQSPAHKFGQMIGNIIEDALDPLFREAAKQHGLFLDRKGTRSARKRAKLVRWTDIFDNTHSLDFVFERGGTDTNYGDPAAFIEIAWRRYTKHSKNKAQELQGAILPLREKNHHLAPFVGAVIAGFFTEEAFKQLRSHGFQTLHFSPTVVFKAFASVGVDISCSENTPVKEFKKRIKAIEKLSNKKMEQVKEALRKLNNQKIEKFMDQLVSAIERQITMIEVFPLHGKLTQWKTVREATNFIENYVGDGENYPIVEYLIQVTYNNNDEIKARLSDKTKAISFLDNLLKWD